MADPALQEALTAYVKASPADTPFIQTCLETAVDRITRAVGDAHVPSSTMRQAILEVGANLYHRRMNAHDHASIGDGDMTPAFMRPALDPITPALPLLRPYLPPAIA